MYWWLVHVSSLFTSHCGVFFCIFASSLQLTRIHQRQSPSWLVKATFLEVKTIYSSTIHHPQLPSSPVASVASVARPSDPRRDALLPLAPRALFLGAFHVQQPHAEGEEGAEGHEGRSGDTRGHQEGSHRRHLRLGGGMGVVFQNGKEWWKLIVTMWGRWCDNGDMWIVSKQGMRVKKLSCCAKIAFHVLLCARIMALCNPAVAQGSPILLRHCHGVLGKRKKMSREREVNKESQRKDSKRKRCQVNGMSRERDVQRKTGREREMSRDFKVKRRKFIIKWFRKRVRHQEQDISRCPARQSSMLLPNCDLSYAGPKKNANYGTLWEEWWW